MIIKVTQKHIDAGCKESISSCPVALALQEQLHLQGWAVEVDSCTLVLAGESFTSPGSVDDFISLFDNGLPVKPFSFRIPKPKAYIA